MDPFKKQRQRMIEEHIEARGIKNPKVLEAMKTIPRELFVNSEDIQFSYADSPLSIEEGQTISQPYMVALMTELAEISPSDKVLEIGTGSGYSAAILSKLASQVFTIERHAKLAEIAKARLQSLQISNISVHVGDGTIGLEENAPYDAIIVTAGAPLIPGSLLKQLAVGGRLIIPIGPQLENQQLVRVIRGAEDSYRQEIICAVRFVPLLGQEGWNNL